MMTSEYLTPEEIDALESSLAEWGDMSDRPYDEDTRYVDDMRAVLATLRAYAEVVGAVAENEPMEHQGDSWYSNQCVYCATSSDFANVPAVHDPDCPYLRARELRGKS